MFEINNTVRVWVYETAYATSHERACVRARALLYAWLLITARSYKTLNDILTSRQAVLVVGQEGTTELINGHDP